MAEREAYQRDLQRANEIMDQMWREDPDAWQDYIAELRSFDTGTSGDALIAAARDWPEYNDDRGATGGALGR
jgi:hypothetical protein